MSAQALVAAAVAARGRAYAPYSQFAVGAALAMADHAAPVCGVNVENCSFGLTICAERHAVGAAVLQGMRRGGLQAVAVAASAVTLTPPCGACRQVLAEFAADDALLHLHNVRDGRTETMTLMALLPQAFLPTSLPSPV